MPPTCRGCSLGFEQVRFFAGVWSGRDGRFWLDDLRNEEVALVNLLRRPGTPLLVRDAQSDTKYRKAVTSQP